MSWSPSPEDDIITNLVMSVNTEKKGALIFSSGQEHGGLQGIRLAGGRGRLLRDPGLPGYLWLGHNRYPTNTPGWWGGAHPFNLLGWSVVHNGEITSYGTNQRYIQSFGYHCTMFTDTEVVAYLFDLLVRKHQLPEDLAVKALAPPFWDEIDMMDEKERESTPPSGSRTARPS